MGRGLAVLAIAWPIVAGAAVAAYAAGVATTGAAIVYAVGALVCHQQPDRSFQTAGVPWPVCARCAGLYLGAMAGGLWGLGHGFRWIRRRDSRRLLVIAAIPTVVAWAAEWLGGAFITNGARALAALPLGAAVLLVIAAVASETTEVDPVN